MLTKEEYFSYYEEKGKTIDQIAKPNNPLNEKQLQTKYDKYVKKNSQEIIFENDEEWEKVRDEAFERDKNSCRLLSILPYEEASELKINSRGLYKLIDPAHVFGKGAFPHLKYDIDNVVCLNRWSHINLDNCKCPISGKGITKERRDGWWRFILGSENYNLLIKKK